MDTMTTDSNRYLKSNVNQWSVEVKTLLKCSSTDLAVNVVIANTTEVKEWNKLSYQETNKHNMGVVWQYICNNYKKKQNLVPVDQDFLHSSTVTVLLLNRTIEERNSDFAYQIVPAKRESYLNPRSFGNLRFALIQIVKLTEQSPSWIMAMKVNYRLHNEGPCFCLYRSYRTPKNLSTWCQYVNCAF